MALWLLAAICVGVLTVACGGGGNGAKADGAAAGGTPGQAAAPAKSWAGKDPAPDFPTGLTWFNVDHPLTLQELRGKVVLLDFWTLGCINCQHIIPDLKRLESEFGDKLAVIGVHSGKYSTEHEDDAVREAIERYGLDHAVVNDPDFAFWNRYGANAWPTLVLVDPAGKLVGAHAGEGVYPLFQPIVASLVQEFGAKGELSDAPLPLKPDDTAPATVLSFPGKVLADAQGGRLFIADSGHNRVLVAGLDGALKEAIGDGKEGFADGAASEAEFRQPQGLALSPDGKTLYVADTRNHAVRAVDLASGQVTTIAGTGAQLDRMPAAGARADKTALASPWDLVVEGQTLFISMAGVHELWAMDLAKGTIGIFAGTSREGIQDGARLTQATLAQPSGLTSDGHYLYWVDPEGSAVRRVPIAGEGEVETITGTGLFDYGDEDGQGTKAKLQHPQGIVYADGTLYVADTYNHKIKAINAATFDVRTLAGGERGHADGTGAAAGFDEPAGLGFAQGKLYVADTNNHQVRVVDVASGAVTSLTLSNLSVATGPGAPGRVFKVTLPEQTVQAGATNIRVRFSAPGGYHLNSQAPSQLTLTTSDVLVLEPGESTVSWSTDEGEVRLPVPAQLSAGQATLSAAGAVYYCRTGEEALCFIQQVEVTAPVNVVESAPQGEVQLYVTLPEAGG